MRQEAKFVVSCVWRAANASRPPPPFAPAYAHYPHRLEAFVNDLRGLMTVSDPAALTGLSWDTVKDIVKKALEKGCGHPRLKDWRYLSMDEIYRGRDKKYRTLVIDLESGRIVWVAKGKGAEALRKVYGADNLADKLVAGGRNPSRAPSSPRLTYRD